MELKTKPGPAPLKRRLQMTALNQGFKDLNVTKRLLELIGKMDYEEQQSLLREVEGRPFFWKRLYDRKPYFSLVDYYAQERTCSDFIQNISPGGVFIATSRSLSVGEEVLLAFLIPVSQEHTTIPGEIAWIGGRGAGVRFKAFDHELESKIERVVDMIK